MDDARLFRRSELEDTLAALVRCHHPLSEVVAAVLAQRPVAKAPQYRGNSSTDRFNVNVGAGDAEAIVDALFDLEAASLPPTGETNAVAIRYAQLVDLWNDYLAIADTSH